MGASLDDIRPEYLILWLQAIVYFIVTCIVYRYQIVLSRTHALERLERIGRKLEVVDTLRQRKITRK
jgi:ABC-2 type transport system permease protein